MGSSLWKIGFWERGVLAMGSSMVPKRVSRAHACDFSTQGLSGLGFRGSKGLGVATACSMQSH